MRTTTADVFQPGVDRDRLRRMVEAALPLARARAQMVGEMKEALERGDDQSALAIGRRLCGLPPAEILR